MGIFHGWKFVSSVSPIEPASRIFSGGTPWVESLARSFALAPSWPIAGEPKKRAYPVTLKRTASKSQAPELGPKLAPSWGNSSDSKKIHPFFLGGDFWQFQGGSFFWDLELWILFTIVMMWKYCMYMKCISFFVLCMGTYLWNEYLVLKISVTLFWIFDFLLSQNWLWELQKLTFVGFRIPSFFVDAFGCANGCFRK